MVPWMIAVSIDKFSLLFAFNNVTACKMAAGGDHGNRISRQVQSHLLLLALLNAARLGVQWHLFAPLVGPRHPQITAFKVLA